MSSCESYIVGLIRASRAHKLVEQVPLISGIVSQLTLSRQSSEQLATVQHLTSHQHYRHAAESAEHGSGCTDAPIHGVRGMKCESDASETRDLATKATDALQNHRQYIRQRIVHISLSIHTSKRLVSALLRRGRLDEHTRDDTQRCDEADHNPDQVAPPDML